MLNLIKQENLTICQKIMSKSSISVADYIDRQLALSGKTQTDVCFEIGYKNPNLLTMLKKGKTKLPIIKVKLLAKSLGVDPVYLLKLTMLEYTPDTWDVIQDIMGAQAVTDDEYAILREIREVSGGMSLAPSNDEERHALQELANKWKKRAISEHEPRDQRLKTH